MGLFKFLKEKLGSKKDEQKDKYVAGLDKSRKNFASRLKKLASTHTKIDDEYFEELEQILIEADVGVNLALDIVDVTKKEAHWKRDKNVRDILIHLHEWHNLMLEWVTNNKAGVRKLFLMEGYNWKSYGEMNIVFWKRNQTVSLDMALQNNDSFRKDLEFLHYL